MDSLPGPRILLLEEVGSLHDPHLLARVLLGASRCLAWHFHTNGDTPTMVQAFGEQIRQQH